jgi:hypothetical protein
MARDRRLALVAPLLLVALAALQIGLATGFGLSPWKGGGFGMFATLDHPGLREVRLLAGDDGHRIALPSDARRLRDAALVWPSPGRLGALARAVEAEQGSVVVEVWRARFDGELAVHWECLARWPTGGRG